MTREREKRRRDKERKKREDRIERREKREDIEKRKRERERRRELRTRTMLYISAFFTQNSPYIFTHARTYKCTDAGTDDGSDTRFFLLTMKVTLSFRKGGARQAYRLTDS